ncbi:hypothetical protein RFI_25651 [Reticulomyxa filosa]|uniref:Uncharacterized protein n=1 Tax=Reticulomyxa filosa TaxID=46433 RepID=X6MCV9_RETFI|nr:hypothetical protein RFI_25651 [Reticulomyxa filosa]|eukprot:ETO11724.1 hypothetical protein RFI_25651 [Reticulomyxa filosa]
MKLMYFSTQTFMAAAIHLQLYCDMMPSPNLLTLFGIIKAQFLKLKDVKQSNEYKTCCNVLKGWDSLLDEAIKDMLMSNDKIGYKEQGGISYDIRYGYKTLFACYHEHSQNKISAESLKKQYIYIPFIPNWKFFIC